MKAELMELVRRITRIEKRLDDAVKPEIPPAVASARVYDASDQTIGTAAWTAVEFDTERWDTDTIHSAAANTKLTCNTSGIYVISGHVRFAGDATSTGLRDIRIRLNDTATIAQERRTNIDTNAIHLSITTQYQLDAGTPDYVELEVYQNTGGNLDIKAQANYTNEFMMTRIR